MLLERGRHLPRLLLYGIGVICLCVMMYMLGTTMSLWTMQFALDQADNMVLEGFSLPTTLPDMNPAMPVSSSPDTSSPVKRDVNDRSLLRPPNRIA
ncbi:MAG TPA: hypothetical protein VJL88_05115 [Nitrospira sp.]|nr:hypothetical protein [Nitrospira sp.]